MSSLKLRPGKSAQLVCRYLIKSQERVVNEASQLEESGANANQLDLPTSSLDKLDEEQRELLDVVHEQLRIALAEAIEQEVRNRITTLRRSKKYSSLTKQYIPGLQLYYCEGMPLREIAPKLGMTSWNQARRILNPGELLEKVRTLTLQKLIDSILKKGYEKGLTPIPPKPDYLKSLAEQIEAFADQEVFQEAAEEIRAGKNRSMDSVYAQLLRSYLQEKDSIATNGDSLVEVMPL